MLFRSPSLATPTPPQPPADGSPVPPSSAACPPHHRPATSPPGRPCSCYSAACPRSPASQKAICCTPSQAATAQTLAACSTTPLRRLTLCEPAASTPTASSSPSCTPPSPDAMAYYTTDQISRAAGCSPAAARYYLRKGGFTAKITDHITRH